MKHKIFVILAVFILYMDIYAEMNNDCIITEITSNEPVLEEWKFPGRYSPDNIFDGNNNTCYSIRDEGINLTIKFIKTVKIDEIRIMNGYSKNDNTYFENNRVSKCTIFMNLNDKIISEEELTLKDQKEFQSIRLKNDYKIDQFSIYSFRSDNLYKGSKYNDFCITEIEFYYKGQKMEVQNLGELKNNYINKINQNLHEALTDREYIIFSTCHGAGTCTNITFVKDGTINFSNEYSLSDEPEISLSEFFPKFWKIDDNKLYMLYSKNEKWKLFQYEILRNDESKDWISHLIIYTDRSVHKGRWTFFDEKEYDKRHR